MGVLCDIFSATEPDVAALRPGDVPTEKFGGVEAKGLNPVPLATLHHILTGADVQESVRQHSCVAELSEDGPWVYRMPDELAAALAALADKEADSAATSWSATQELQLSGWTIADVQSVLKELVALCRQAEADGRAIYVWNCL